MATSNTAAFITGAKVRPLEVRAAPLGVPGENQILVKNAALAVNPVDYKVQAYDLFSLKYPVILGEDVAGTVAAVGPNVSAFKEGDRVAGNTAGFMTKQSSDHGFQQYTILPTNMASKIPASLSFERAVVLPLGLSTAASGLFHPDVFALDVPTSPPAPKKEGKVALVWGGASSVGLNAIQVLVAAGYEVVTTASAKNFELVKSLGASAVFDYNKTDTVVADLVGAAKGKSVVAVFDAVSEKTTHQACFEFIQKTDGTKLIATVQPASGDIPEGVKTAQVFATSIMQNHVAKAVWQDFLPKALEAGTFIPAPEPLVVGKGLESLQEAIDVMGRGVSAKKVVVTL